jgi:hypothetical protein
VNTRKVESSFFDLEFLKQKDSTKVSLAVVIEKGKDFWRGKRFEFKNYDEETVFFELKLTPYTNQGVNSVMIQLRDVTES